MSYLPDRVQCCVPFCTRSYANAQGYDEWICSQHWRLVPRKLRKLYAAAKRRRKSPSVIHYLWRKCRAAAIEAAGGIA